MKLPRFLTRLLRRRPGRTAPAALRFDPEPERPPAVVHDLIALADRLAGMSPETIAAPEHRADFLRWLSTRTREMLLSLEVSTLNDTGRLDVLRHEAVGNRPANDPAAVDHIAETVRPGYAWRGELLRPQQVVAYVSSRRTAL
jgi:hypothetical protein